MVALGLPGDLRVCFYDLLTGTFLATLPVTQLQFSDTLNAAGSFSCTIAMTDPQVRAALLPVVGTTAPSALQATTPGMVCAVIDLAGVPLNCYPIVSRKRHSGPDGQTMQLTGASLWWWLTKRAQATDYSNPPYSGITGPTTPMTYWTQANYGADAIVLQILSDMIEYAWYGQAGSGFGTPSPSNLFNSTTYPGCSAGVGLLLNGTAYSGGTSVSSTTYYIAPTFPYSSVSTIDSILSQITQLGWNIGVDVTFSLAYEDDGGINSPLQVAINVSWPRKGSLATAGSPTIDGSRARTYDFTEDSTNQGTITYTTGGTGDLAIVDNVAPLEAGWPILEQITDYSDVNSQNYDATLDAGNIQDVLQSMANADSYQSSFPVFSGTITMPLWGTDPQFGTFETGDDAILWLPSDFNFAAGLVEDLRVVSWTANLPEQGDQTVQLTLNVPPGIPSGDSAFPDGDGPLSRSYP